MGGFDVFLELALVVLLGATLLHAVRLHRALSRLGQDRAALHDAVMGFDSGTRQAEAGLTRLREVADQLGAQLGTATSLRDDLAFLSERGEVVADRLDVLVRSGRAMESASTPGNVALGWSAPPEAPERTATVPKVRSHAERNLLVALQGRR